MNNTFLDTMINKKNQLKSIIGLLCILVLYIILVNIESVMPVFESKMQRELYILGNTIMFLYLYKFVRYDLNLKMSFIFTGFVVFINAYYMLSLKYFDGSILSFSVQHGILLLKQFSIIGVAIQLIINNYFKKKIRRALLIVGICFIVQLIGPLAAINIYPSLPDMNDLHNYVILFFNSIVYISMIYLYVFALYEDLAYEEIQEEERI